MSTTVAGRPRLRMTLRAVILAGSVAVLGVAWVYPVKLWLAQRREISTLEQQTSQLRVENASLDSQMQELRDPVYLQELARECLGMIGKDQIAFIIGDRNSPVAASGACSIDAPPPR